MSYDVVALIVSFVYVFAMIGVAEGLRKWRGLPVDFTRKFVHIGVGMWAYGTVLLFETRTFAIIPPLSFVAINAFSYWRGTFKAMETGDRGNLGTVYFPIAFVAIVWLLWDQRSLVVASLMPMTWGDALAAVIGRPFGKRRYTVLGSTRSLEGSAVMFLAGWVAVFIPLLLFATVEPVGALWISAVTALGATVMEAVSPWGIDNLTVPAVSAVLLAVLV
jgi:phytol kinase